MDRVELLLKMVYVKHRVWCSLLLVKVRISDSGIESGSGFISDELEISDADGERVASIRDSRIQLSERDGYREAHSE
jgi:hypothetical protein